MVTTTGDDRMTTKNGDMPAMPAGETKWAGDAGITSLANPGLTKREEFARSCLVGLLAAPDLGDGFNSDFLVSAAVQYADKLLAELERTK